MLSFKFNKNPKIPNIDEADASFLNKYDDEWIKYSKKKEFGLKSTRPIDFNINLLCIADLHGISLSEDMENFLYERLDIVDNVVLLGDICTATVRRISEMVPLEKLIGVIGNHDNYRVLEQFGIKNIHNTIYETAESIKIAGFEGSIKYKTGDYPSYSHRNSIELLESLEPADILISHDIPYESSCTNAVHHKGMMGLTNYIYDNRIPVNIHGHIHQNNTHILKNGCNSIGVYGMTLIKITSTKNKIQIENQDDLI